MSDKHNNIKSIRVAKLMTLEELSGKTGIDIEMLEYYENGGYPDEKTWHKINEVLFKE